MSVEIHEIPLLLGNRNKIYTSRAVFVTEDANAYKFKIKMKDHEGYNEDISWADSATIKFAKPDSTVVIGTATIIDAAQGLIEYDLGAQETAVKGNVLATIQLNAIDKRITSQIFKFAVILQIAEENMIPSETEYSILTDLISQVQALFDAPNVTSVNGRSGVVTLDSSDVGLENVSNLAPADMPVSTLQQAAIDFAVNQILDGVGTDLDTLKELATALNNDADFATTIYDLIAGMNSSAEFDAHILIQELKTSFKEAYATNYSEINSVDGLIVSINVWSDNTKTIPLFTKVLSYSNGEVSQIVTTDLISSKTLTRNLVRPDDDTLQITEVIV